MHTQVSLLADAMTEPDADDPDGITKLRMLPEDYGFGCVITRRQRLSFRLRSECSRHTIPSTALALWANGMNQSHTMGCDIVFM